MQAGLRRAGGGEAGDTRDRTKGGNVGVGEVWETSGDTQDHTCRAKLGETWNQIKTASKRSKGLRRWLTASSTRHKDKDASITAAWAPGFLIGHMHCLRFQLKISILVGSCKPGTDLPTFRDLSLRPFCGAAECALTKMCSLGVVTKCSRDPDSLAALCYYLGMVASRLPRDTQIRRPRARAFPYSRLVGIPRTTIHGRILQEFLRQVRQS